MMQPRGQRWVFERMGIKVATDEQISHMYISLMGKPDSLLRTPLENISLGFPSKILPELGG
ncbi:hypothetical protein PILCRDRAFT_812801 [Piloderma croceum F 1598]|uniref:Uncharacterized protein n=1 Tax=Piloderma croceum (strain F 1598) TaxID=765440 RepID=A0A0C3G175_PILCF|nr:hypothetical protein PILCRDRAFT_812801 [Piloderma croceum F 1598]